MIQRQIILSLTMISLLLSCCSCFQIDNIISPMRISLLRTLQIDKEDWKEDSIKQQNLLDNNKGYDMNTRQKRLLDNYRKSVNEKTNIYGFTLNSELVNGRIAMIAFIICFFIENVTDASIIEQFSILEHNFHVSLYILIMTFTIQPMLAFFKDDGRQSQR